MKAGIFGRTYPLQTAAEVFEAAQHDGFAALQFNLSCVGLPSLPPQPATGILGDVAELSRSRGIEIAALSGTYNMAHPDSEVRRVARSAFAHVVDAAVVIGVPLVTLCTGTRNPADMWAHHPNNGSAEAWRDMRLELDAALELADARGIRLAVEPEPGNIVCDARAARRLLSELSTGAPIGIVLDAANLVGHALDRQSEIMDEAFDLLGVSIVLAHAKDVDASGRVTCPGDGVVDLRGFAERLRQSGYDGALIGHGFRADDAARAGAFIGRLIEETEA